jgi:hypothetical protein
MLLTTGDKGLPIAFLLYVGKNSHPLENKWFLEFQQFHGGLNWQSGVLCGVEKKVESETDAESCPSPYCVT